MAKKDKLNKKQVLAIPKLLNKKPVQEIAEEYGVTYASIWYWIRVLRKKGYKVETRKRGSRGLLD